MCIRDRYSTSVTPVGQVQLPDAVNVWTMVKPVAPPIRPSSIAMIPLMSAPYVTLPVTTQTVPLINKIVATPLVASVIVSLSVFVPAM